MKMATEKAPDKTPPQIEVWVCPECGYWRKDESTGVHQVFGKESKGELHPLVKTTYIYDR